MGPSQTGLEVLQSPGLLAGVHKFGRNGVVLVQYVDQRWNAVLHRLLILQLCEGLAGLVQYAAVPHTDNAHINFGLPDSFQAHLQGTLRIGAEKLHPPYGLVHPDDAPLHLIPVRDQILIGGGDEDGDIDALLRRCHKPKLLP